MIERDDVAEIGACLGYQSDITDLVKEAWNSIRFKGHDSTALSVQRLKVLSAKHLQLLLDLNNSISRFHGQSDLRVGDIHIENCGLSKNEERLVVSDFGTNNFQSVLGHSLLREIPIRSATDCPRRTYTRNIVAW